MIPSAATLYSFRGSAYPSLLVRGKNNAVKLPCYRSGALVAPSAATYTLVDSSGVALVDAASCTISSSVATYTVLAAALPSMLTPGEGYQERWIFTISGEAATVEVLRPAVVAVADIYPVITDTDLYGSFYALQNYLSGSLTSYQTFIDEAWNQIIARLVRQGRLPYCIRTPDALRDVHLHQTLQLIFQSFGMSAESGHWREMAAAEKKEIEKAWMEVTLQMDSDQNRLVDDPTRRDTAVVPIFFSPAAPRSSAIWRRV